MPFPSLDGRPCLSLEALCEHQLRRLTFRPDPSTGQHRCVLLHDGAHTQDDGTAVLFTTIAQLVRYSCVVETHGDVADPGAPADARATSVALWFEQRPDPVSALQWEALGKNLGAIVGRAGQSVDATPLYLVDEADDHLKFAMHASQLHARDQDAGYPLYDSEGDRIWIDDTASLPYDTALRAVFELQYGEVPSLGDGVYMHAKMLYAAFP